MGDIYIKALNIYPLKSCAPVPVDEVTITEHGLLYDRGCGVIAADTRTILNQKGFPALGRIRAEILPVQGTLRIYVPASPNPVQVDVPLDAPGSNEETITGIKQWNSDDLNGTILSPELDLAVSELLGKLVHVVRFVGRPRKVDSTVPITPHPGDDPKKHVGPMGRQAIQPPVQGKEFSTLLYQDMFALHLISTASLSNVQVALLKSIYPDEKLDPALVERGESTKYPACAYSINKHKVDLNLWTPEYIKSLPLERFRSNIVLDGPGLRPWEEDEWSQVEVTHGDQAHKVDIQFRTGRCSIITMNQGEKDDSLLPNRVMSRYRNIDPLQRYSPVFGVYGTPNEPGGTLSVGDPVRVLRTGSRPVLTKDGHVQPAKRTTGILAGVPLGNVLFVLFICLLGIGLGILVATQK